MLRAISWQFTGQNINSHHRNSIWRNFVSYMIGKRQVFEVRFVNCCRLLQKFDGTINITTYISNSKYSSSKLKLFKQLWLFSETWLASKTTSINKIYHSLTYCCHFCTNRKYFALWEALEIYHPNIFHWLWCCNMGLFLHGKLVRTP